MQPFGHDSLTYPRHCSNRGSCVSSSADSRGMGGGTASASQSGEYQRQKTAVFEAL